MKSHLHKDPAKKHFAPGTTDRERAIFEGGITLGAIYHQFVGTPVRDPRVLERAIEQAALAQPFIESAKAKITVTKRKPRTPYDYPELSGKMISLTLTSRYGVSWVKLGIRYSPALDYPLMRIEALGPK